MSVLHLNLSSAMCFLDMVEDNVRRSICIQMQDDSKNKWPPLPLRRESFTAEECSTRTDQEIKGC